MSGKYFYITLLFFAITISQSLAKSQFDHFITRSGDKLYDGDQVYRFISFNIPNLHYIEDNMSFEEINPWRLPDAFEIADALKSVKQQGGQVVRIYTLSVRKADDSNDIPRHVLAPGKFNEDAFRALDKVMQLANEIGVRVIIPFVDNWSWWGGKAEYAAFRGKKAGAFWTDPQLIADYEKTVKYLINRTNVYTGIKYKDDKALMAWETGNELQCPHSWTAQVVPYIKSLDANHLVIDGYHTSLLRDESISEADIDIVTTHHYPKDPMTFIEQVKTNMKKAEGKKPYFIGEFGFISTAAVEKFLDLVIDSNISGALIWSLRFRDRDGGFYWHSEPAAGYLYKAYHWPGFRSGDKYDEENLLHLLQRKAFAIRGLTVPQLNPPDAPKLLPIKNLARISWQGSVGAVSYNVERAQNKDGPWKLVGTNISDAAKQYSPLFSDTSAKLGASYFYRIVAVNPAGKSKPSNIVGPVKATHLVLVDEMVNNGKIFQQHGTIKIVHDESRQAKEDTYRLKAEKGSSIVYYTPLPISSWIVNCFFPKNVIDLKFSVSSDGARYQPLPAKRVDFFSGEGLYGYWKPVQFRSASMKNDALYLRIEFPVATQISRTEIFYGR